MNAERLFVIHGAGPDDIGLVGRITAPLAAAGANVVDLRQDVLHGLFTVNLVADFAKTAVDLEGCEKIIVEIERDTALRLAVARFTPVPRDPLTKNLLLVLVGKDKPGVAASISGRLSHYRVNIEFSKMIAREGVFLMELQVDVSGSTVPLDNLEREIRAAMTAMDIETVVQREDVFNRKKRLVVFAVGKSLMPDALANELAKQAGLSPAEIRRALDGKTPADMLALLEDLPEDALEKIIRSARPTPGAQELVQTLKTFGYRLAVCGPVCLPLSRHVAALFGLDAAGGFPVPVDPDSRRVTGETLGEKGTGFDEERFIRATAESENMSSADVTVIRGAGISLVPDTRLWLELFNGRVFSCEHMLGLFGLFGFVPGRR